MTQIEIVARRSPPPSAPRIPLDRPSDPFRPSETTLPSAHVQHAVLEARLVALRDRRSALAARIGLPDLREDQEPFFQVFHLLAFWGLVEMAALGAPLPLLALAVRRVIDGQALSGVLVGVSAGTAFGIVATRLKEESRARRILRDYRDHHAACRDIHVHERLLERWPPS